MIAPEPISATVSSGTERHPRMAADGQTHGAVSKRNTLEALPRPAQSAAEFLPPLPPPPDPPGTAYLAAVLSGALSPKPASTREILLRTGEWTPPDSPLHLADKTA